MKKILVLMLIASAFATISASAQTSPETRTSALKSRGGMSKQYLVDSLKLSDASADSVIAIRSQTMSQIKTIMSDQSLSQDQKKEKIRPIKEEMKTRLEKYLSKEQMAKMQEMRKSKGDENQ